MENDPAALRESYADGRLDDSAIAGLRRPGGWLELAGGWLDDAVAAHAPEPNAMVLAVVDADGAPTARTVLCKAMSERGVVFYTNLGSDKARAIAATGRAAVTFPWIAIARQLHVRGAVTRVADDVALEYWRSRPRGSRLGAWASRQSAPVASRAVLDAEYDAVSARFDGVEDIPLPEFWGGFEIAAETVEFWHGRVGRLHDRLRVLGANTESPIVTRLEP